MIRRLYINNFRCLENFDLNLSGQSSALLIGKNGSGKTTVSLALEVLQKIARGTNGVQDLLGVYDFYLSRTDAPIRFEIETDLGGTHYEYIIAIELEDGSKEMRVREESLTTGGNLVFARRYMPSVVAVPGSEADRQSLRFNRPGVPQPRQVDINRRLVALPIIQEQSTEDPLFVFKRWLAQMLILRPVPSLIKGGSDRETLQLLPEVSDFGAWFSGLLALAPGAYLKIEEYLRLVMPDFKDIKNPLVGKDARNLLVQFSNGNATLSLDFKDLSDGEKCFMICAMVLAANHAYGPLLCFWDEPDNYLAPSEVGHFVMDLRKAFQSGGQFIATSHNPEAILQFSDENTFVLHRKSHLEPTVVRPLSDLNVGGDLVTALITGDLEP